MRKTFYLLMLTALFVSCSSDDDYEKYTGPYDDGNNNSMIDEKILGKWKVEYSKTIKPARYNETIGKPEYGKDAKIKEYYGNIGEPDISPLSGLFYHNEFQIEIKKDNSIISHRSVDNPKIINYEIEDGYLKWINKVDNSATVFIKYKLDGNKLTMETIRRIGFELDEYRISEYSRITE